MITNYNKSKNVIIIPARGGSKEIKNKNLVNFCGKPLLYWTIKQALSCKFVNEVFVSSDSDEILSFSKTNGARTIKRPKKLSTDISQSEEAILHVLKETKNFFKTIIFLQATSPLRKRDDIDNAIKTFYKKNPQDLLENTLEKNKNEMNELGWDLGKDNEELLEYSLHKTQYIDFKLGKAKRNLRIAAKIILIIYINK